MKSKKPEIYKEKEKTRQTTHWDLDYLPKEEVDALYRRGNLTIVSTSSADHVENTGSVKKASHRLALTLIGSGITLLVLSLVVAALF